MSFNIDQWVNQEINGLELPMDWFRNLPTPELKRKNWGPADFPIRLSESGVVRIGSVTEDGIVTGTINPERDTLVVQDIGCRGEWSRMYYHDVLVPALRKSIGILRAILVWEAGEYIMRLTIINGAYLETEIDLKTL